MKIFRTEIYGKNITHQPIFHFFALVNCEYSDWGEWAECDKACGGGSQLRSREVKRQAWYGGIKCTEVDSKETQNCNVQACPGIFNILLF